MVEMQAVPKGCALMLLSRGIRDGRTKSTHLDEMLPAAQLGAGDGATAWFLDVDLAGMMAAAGIDADVVIEVVPAARMGSGVAGSSNIGGAGIVGAVDALVQQADFL
ncbi:hypothetical protein H0H81_007424, partial [Sphagnurus paluster]